MTAYKSTVLNVRPEHEKAFILQPVSPPPQQQENRMTEQNKK